MDLRNQFQRLKYDVRLIEFNKTQKLLTDAELKKHLDGLQDSASQSESVKLLEPDENQH